MKREICNECERPHNVCFCEDIIKQKNKVQLVIIQHPEEKGHYLNTAVMAKMTFDNIILKNEIDIEIEKLISQAKNPAILYPQLDRNKKILKEEINQIDLLLIPDGTWRKAKRNTIDHPMVQKLPFLSLDFKEEKIYTLRKSKKEIEYSTLEAITYALNKIEEDNFNSALNVLKKQIERQSKFNPRDVK